MKQEPIRIQKVLSMAGVVSRRKAEELIRAGKVKVDGHTAEIGQKVLPARQEITVNGEKIVWGDRSPKIYLALYKPRGYVTTMHDERGRRDVTELVADVDTRVYPVGRLDVNSEGILLMTNDGEFANHMMHPRFHVSKIYRVTIGSDVTDDQLARIASGIDLDGRMTAPALVRVVSKEPGRTVLSITLQEGRNRQIRRMFESLGLSVKRLKRTQYGPVRLGMLRPGEHRSLTKAELNTLKDLTEGPNALS